MVERSIFYVETCDKENTILMNKIHNFLSCGLQLFRNTKREVLDKESNTVLNHVIQITSRKAPLQIS
jgi:hypothetical protein